MSNKNHQKLNNFPDALARVIDIEGIKRAELARRWGVTRGYVSQILGKEDLSPNDETLEKLNKALTKAKLIRSGNDWIVQQATPVDESLKNAIDSVNFAEEQVASYKGVEPSQDYLIQSLELVQKLVTHTLELIRQRQDDK